MGTDIDMDHSTYADIELKITERHYFQGINFWRDFFPGMLGERLVNTPDGEWVSKSMPADEVVLAYSRDTIHKLSTESVRGQLRPENDKYADQTLNSDPVFVVAA